MSSLAARSIVLVGLMGTGKSTVAARVASTLGWTCIDVDALIEARTGRAISDIFAADGEAAFRALEADVATDVLGDGVLGDAAVTGQRPTGAVVALGGGAVLTPSIRDRLADCDAVVWLHAQPAVLARRLAGDTSRPLLAGDPLGNLTRLAAERAAAYEAAAHVIVDVDGLPFDAITERVARHAPVPAGRPAAGAAQAAPTAPTDRNGPVRGVRP